MNIIGALNGDTAYVVDAKILPHLTRSNALDKFDYKNLDLEDFQGIVNGIKMSNLQADQKSKILQNMLLTKDLTSEENNKLNQLLKTI